MTGFPILDHDLKKRSHSGRNALWRILLSAGGFVVVMGFLQVGRFAGWTPVRLGDRLFHVLSLLGIAYCLLAGLVLTADCLSSEKRQGTLQLLFLSNLPPSNIVLGKLVACSLPAYCALFAFFPLLALPFFLGGITPGEFWRTAFVLISLLTTSLVVCAWISAHSFSGRKALAGAASILAVWFVLPWLWIPTGHQMPLAGWFPDPLHFWIAARDQEFQKAPSLFHTRLAVIWLATVLGCGWTIWSTNKLLNAPIKVHKAGGQRFHREWSPRELQLRERWYSLNPVAWVARQRAPLKLPILVFMIVFVGTGVTSLYWSDSLMSQPDVFMTYVFCLHGLLKLWLAWELSRCLSRDQSDGLLEPLLAAPLTEHQIVHGWITGLQTVFRWPVVLLLAMDFVVWWTCDLSSWRYPLLAMMGTVVFDAFTLLWAGLYFGLIARNATRGLLQTVGLVLLGPWFCGLALLALLAALQLQWLVPSSMFGLCIVWVGIGLSVDAVLCFHCSRQLGGNFRHLVAEKT